MENLFNNQELLYYFPYSHNLIISGTGTWGLGCDKQTTPDIYAEFVVYNFWWS